MTTTNESCELTAEQIRDLYSEMPREQLIEAAVYLTQHEREMRLELDKLQGIIR